MITDRHATVAEGLAKLPGPAGERWAIVLEHGTLEVGLYAPKVTDVVVTGHGEFVNGANRARFAPGDVLFVPAGVPHRFEDFSDDLVVWVMFYGPEGGEAGMGSAP